MEGGRRTATGLCVFDPSPLLTVTIEPSGPQSEIHFHAGGQGFWIARMARRLGADVTLAGSFGGEAGMLIAPLVEQQGIRLQRTDVARSNGAYIQDRRSGARTLIAETVSPPLTRHEVDDLYGATLAAALRCGAIVLAGPHTENIVPMELYGRLTSDLSSLGITVIGDLSGAALHSALSGGIDVLKVSEDDMRRDGLLAGDDLAAPMRLLDDLHGRGATTVVLTRGDHPALAFVEQTALQIRCPPLRAVDHRGAGDAMTAAIAVALCAGSPLVEALRLGAAAGAAAVTRRGLASGRRDAVSALVPYVDVQPIELISEE